MTPRPVARGRLLLLLALVLAGSAPAARGDRADALPERYREWLLEVELLLSKAERRDFLALEADYQRDAFIESFWKARDADPATDRNATRDVWYSRLEHAREEYGNWTEDRARVLLLNGQPAVQERFSCGLVLHPIEVWHYPWSDRLRRSFQLLFYEPWGLPPARLWTPRDGYLVLFSEPKEYLEQRCQDRTPRTGPNQPFYRGHIRDDDISLRCALRLLADLCGGRRADLASEAILALEMEEEVGGNVETMLARLVSRPDPEQEEWLATFAAHSTEVPADAGRLAAQVAVRFPGRYQSRTVVDVELRVPREEATPSELGRHSSFDFILTGEVLLGDELFESFRYSFGIPEPEAPAVLPLVFRRHLRPGEYRLVMKLEDVHGRRFFRGEERLTVPTAPEPAAGAPEPWALEAIGVLEGDEGPAATVEIQAPEEGVLVGGVRLEAAVRAEGVAKLAFFLDGKPVFTRTRPPYTVELDLGAVPRPHTVRAVAYDRAGRELATDELEINAGENRFAVRIVEPRSGGPASGLVPVRVEVHAPEGAALDRLEIYRSESLVATLSQAPFVQPVAVGGGAEYLRAVAHLADGATAEDTILVNVEGGVEEVNVELVELYATVLGPDGRPVTGLTAADFRVREDGVPQEIVRFEPVADRPVHLAIVMDASASMEEHLPRARRAAVGFLEAFLTPRDRAALVAFNDRPRMLESLTGDVGALAEEVAGFTAEGNTALWDSVVFALHHLGGIQGQRALLLLTDGRDETSRFDFDQTLAYARAMGTTIYAIGIGTDVVTRRRLGELADESGGRSFRIDRSDELEAIYETIARELRAGYLVVYQSSRSDGDAAFRRVEAELTRPGHRVRTIRGYYP
jgi:Ca-activated chloride channel family protein